MRARLRWALMYPKRAGWMSLAGPLANLALVFVSAGIIHTGVALGAFSVPGSGGFDSVTEAAAGGAWGMAATFASILFTLNLLLFVFNLLPMPPFDGSGVLALFVDESRGRKLQLLWQQPGFAIAGMLAAWYLVGPVFRRVFLFAVNSLYPGVSYG